MAQTLGPADFAALRQTMVVGQLRTVNVTDLSVLAAFGKIPRERFVPQPLASLAYLDRHVPALGGAGRLLLAPMLLAKMIQAAAIRPKERVLDVAGGSGYAAALMEELGADVQAVESDAGAADAARAIFAAGVAVPVTTGDLDGKAPEGPFDLIFINGAFERSPDALLARLSDSGRLIGVNASGGSPTAVIIEKSAGGMSERPLFDASAPLLEAFAEPKLFAF